MTCPFPAMFQILSIEDSVLYNLDLPKKMGQTSICVVLASRTLHIAVLRSWILHCLGLHCEFQMVFVYLYISPFMYDYSDKYTEGGIHQY